MAKRSNAEATAYHEAGHAVAALIHGIPLVYVSVIEDGDYLGRCQTVQGGLHQTGRLQLFSLSGHAAERKYRGRANWIGAADDLEDFYRGARSKSIDYFDYYDGLAAEFVAKPSIWAAIQSLAARLLVQKRLESAEVGKIVIEAIEAIEPIGGTFRVI